MENQENAVVEESVETQSSSEQVETEATTKDNQSTSESTTDNSGKNVFVRFGLWCKNLWDTFKGKYPGIAQFLVFFVVCNGVTVFQLALMPILRIVFENATNLTYVNFQVFPVGEGYIFDFASGLTSEGGKGGLAFFLASYITIAIAQVINFFIQRNVTFKGKNNVWIAAMWYAIAFIAIVFVSSAALNLYQPFLYDVLSDVEWLADVVVMIINSAISFWVFFPIMKLIFKNDKTEESQNEVKTQ